MVIGIASEALGDPSVTKRVQGGRWSDESTRHSQTMDVVLCRVTAGSHIPGTGRYPEVTPGQLGGGI